MSEEDRLAQAVELVKAGNRAEAQKILAQIILTNKDNARAWMLMARIADDPKRALQCLQQVARLRPNDPRVVQWIARLQGEPLSQMPARTRQPAVPPLKPGVQQKEQSSKSFVTWLIGGMAVLGLVGSGTVYVLANTGTSPASNQQASLTTGTVTTNPEEIRFTSTQVTITVPATITQTVPTITGSSRGITPQSQKSRTATPATATSTPAAETPTPSYTPTLADTLIPPGTAVQPTAAPSNGVLPGTHLVGSGVKAGIYRGQVAFNSICYWARLDDQSEVLAEHNSTGQFYVEVRSTDYVLETRCELTPLESVSPSPGGSPMGVLPGTYLIGKDIPTGIYNGQAEGAGCYWELVSDVAGELDSIIDNDFIVSGVFSVEVTASHFALLTECPLQQ